MRIQTATSPAGRAGVRGAVRCLGLSQRYHRGGGFTLVEILIVVIILAGFGYLIVRQQTDNKSHALLATAMTIVEAPVQPPTPAEPPSNGKPGTMEQQAPGTYPTEEAKLKAALPKLEAAGREAHVISAVTGAGVPELVYAVERRLEVLPRALVPPPEAETRFTAKPAGTAGRWHRPPQ